MNCLSFWTFYFGLLIHLWKGFILLLESSSTFRWNCNLPKLERPINSTSDLVKIICPLICSFLTLQYTLFGFQWSLFSKAFALKFCCARGLFDLRFFTIGWGFRFGRYYPELSPPGVPGWWAQVDSNHRPRAYQARALTTWAMSPFSFSVYLVLSRLIGFAVITAGGDDGNRTHDPLLAGQVLSQLSYTPLWKWRVNSEEWKVKSFGWKASLFFIIHSLWVSLSGSLKIEQQQIGTSKQVPLAPLSHIFSFSFLYLRYSILRLSLDATFSIERRWSSRTFRYGYLVTT